MAAPICQRRLGFGSHPGSCLSIHLRYHLKAPYSEARRRNEVEHLFLRRLVVATQTDWVLEQIFIE
jgi:hypothetical protein